MQIRVVGCAQAVGVGVMLMDGSNVVAKRSGKAVQVLQLYGDNLWEMGSKKEIEFNRNDQNEENLEEDEGSNENLEQVSNCMSFPFVPTIATSIELESRNSDSQFLSRIRQS